VNEIRSWTRRDAAETYNVQPWGAGSFHVHEAGHILLHGKREVFVESQGAESQEEDEANRFAADHLIPAEEFRQFREQAPFTSTRIKSFASMLGIAPGIVVGRLQHERLITFKEFNQLKRRFVW